MDLNHRVKGKIVSELRYVLHKGKGRNYFLKDQSHKMHEIIYVDYGEILLSLNGREITLTPGQCVFIKGGSPHCFRGRDGRPFDFLNICYQGIMPVSIADIPLPTGEAERTVLERMKAEAETERPFRNEMLVCLLSEFIFLMRRLSEAPGPSGAPEQKNNRLFRTEAARRAVSIIERDFAESLTLESVSASAGVSASYLRALLRAETGRGFSRHLQEARVGAARRMLLETPFSIQEISQRVGYQSLPFFFKIFRRITGMTPAACARSLGEPREKTSSADIEGRKH
jgi:AraC-like DNA-binding protein